MSANVQNNSTIVDNAASASLAFAGNVTAGNLLLIYITKYTNAADAFVLGDLTKSAGTATLGTITMDVERQYNATGAEHISAVVYSVPVTGSGSCTFQISSIANSYFVMAVQEISGADIGAARVAGTNEANGASGAPDSGNVTSTAGALFAGVLGTYVVSSTTHTLDAAFTLIVESEDGSAHQSGSIGYRIVGSGTTDSASWTAPTTIPWVAVLAVYKDAAAGGRTTKNTDPQPLGVFAGVSRRVGNTL